MAVAPNSATAFAGHPIGRFNKKMRGIAGAVDRGDAYWGAELVQLGFPGIRGSV